MRPLVDADIGTCHQHLPVILPQKYSTAQKSLSTSLKLPIIIPHPKKQKNLHAFPQGQKIRKNEGSLSQIILCGKTRCDYTMQVRFLQSLTPSPSSAVVHQHWFVVWPHRAHKQSEQLTPLSTWSRQSVQTLPRATHTLQPTHERIDSPQVFISQTSLPKQK